MKTPGTVYYVRFKGVKRGQVGFCNNVKREKVEPGSQIFPVKSWQDKNCAPPGQTMSDSFSRKDVSSIFNIGTSRLEYWDKSGFLSPSGILGKRRRYTFADLISVRSAKTLLENGLSVQKVRKILENLKTKLPDAIYPLHSLHIKGDAKTIIVTRDDIDFEVNSGQLLLDFNVSSIEEKIVDTIKGYKDQKNVRTAYEWYMEGCKLDENNDTMQLAEEAYHRAIYLDPTLANAYTNLGNLMYRTGHISDAIELYKKAIDVDNNQPEAHYNLGYMEFENGRLEKARYFFESSAKLDPEFSDAYFNLAMTFLRLGKTQKARVHLKRYLKLDPSGSWSDVARERLDEINRQH